MDPLARDVLARLPLAEAVLSIWAFLTDAPLLQGLFERFRGRCYEKVIAFPTMVQLIADALLQYHGSGRQAFQRAVDHGELTASLVAAYGKLRRLPVPLSIAFHATLTQHLSELFPAQPAIAVPASVQDLELVILDGKAIKRVAKRLKPLRGLAGGVLGGRALVALQVRTGLAIALHAHPDGDANDVRFLGDVLPEVRRLLTGSRLYIADRQFCGLKQIANFQEAGDHFLVRYSKALPFQRDRHHPLRQGHDAEGRSYTEEWGWLGSAHNPLRVYVRRLTLVRPQQESIILVTDLLEADSYPAVDLLAAYLQRWGIERVFQEITEVFHLQALIGGSPEATIFQLAFCLVLYNIVQVLRAYAAQAGKQLLATVSSEQLFGDLRRQLIAWTEVIDPADTVARFARPLPPVELRQRLKRLLASAWTERWRKAKASKRRPHPVKGKREHSSVFRILQDYRRNRSRAG